jgi:hypothetical protein
MRSQLTSLKALIDAVQGGGITGAVVDGVTTANPGDPAMVNVSVLGTELHFSISIPRGADGAPGPPFTNAVVDAVNTLNPGDPATVATSFDGTNVHFTFGIPQGFSGSQGAPGEVSNNQLSTAIAGTSSNSNSVATFLEFAANDYSQAQLQGLIDKVNELITVLRR